MRKRTLVEVDFLEKNKDRILDRWIERTNQGVHSRFFNGSGLDRPFLEHFFEDLVDAVEKNLYRELNETFDALVEHERRNGYTLKDVKEFLFSFVPSALDVLDQETTARAHHDLIAQRLKSVEKSLRGVYSERSARGLLRTLMHHRETIEKRWIDELPTSIISPHFAVIHHDEREKFVRSAFEIYVALLRGESHEVVLVADSVRRSRLDDFLHTVVDEYEPKGFLISDLLRALSHLGRLAEPYLARDFAANFTEYRIAWLSLQDAMDTLSLQFAYDYNERLMKNYYNEVSIMLHRIKNKLTACPTTLQTILMIPGEVSSAGETTEVLAGDPLILTVEEAELLQQYNALRAELIEAIRCFVESVGDDSSRLSTPALHAQLSAVRNAWDKCRQLLAENESQIPNAEFKIDSANMQMLHELLLMAYDGGNMTTELTRELQLRQNELYQREPPKHREIDFFDMVKRAFDECAVEASAKELKYEFEGEDEGIYVFGVENELKRPFVQIIENAIKYTPEGGSVNVRVGSENGSVLFSVKDTGIGIPPGEENLVFGLCERCSNAKDFNKHGTGTGLYNDRKVILHHNGDIWVESEGIGKGSKFLIRLPIYRKIGEQTAVPRR